METLLTYARNMNYFLLIIFFFFNFGMQFSRNLVDFWLKDETSEKHGSFFTHFNNYFDNSFSKAFTALILFNLIVTFLRAFFYVLLALLACYRLFNKLNKSILYAKMKFFDKNTPGAIINRMGNDISMVN